MTKKRIRCKPINPPGLLSVYWGKAERHDRPDVVFNNGPGCDRADSRLLNTFFCNERMRPSFENFGTIESDPSLVDELKARGYDLTTLKFSIRMKKPLTEPVKSDCGTPGDRGKGMASAPRNQGVNPNASQDGREANAQTVAERDARD